MNYIKKAFSILTVAALMIGTVGVANIAGIQSPITTGIVAEAKGEEYTYQDGARRNIDHIGQKTVTVKGIKGRLYVLGPTKDTNKLYVSHKVTYDSKTNTSNITININPKSGYNYDMQVRCYTKNGSKAKDYVIRICGSFLSSTSLVRSVGQYDNNISLISNITGKDDGYDINGVMDSGVTPIVSNKNVVSIKKVAQGRYNCSYLKVGTCKVYWVNKDGNRIEYNIKVVNNNVVYKSTKTIKVNQGFTNKASKSIVSVKKSNDYASIQLVYDKNANMTYKIIGKKVGTCVLTIWYNDGSRSEINVKIK